MNWSFNKIKYDQSNNLIQPFVITCPEFSWIWFPNLFKNCFSHRKSDHFFDNSKCSKSELWNRLAKCFGIADWVHCWNYKFHGYIQCRCWWQFFSVGDRILILVTSFEWWYPTLVFKRLRMLVTKTVKTVTNISKLSPIQLVSNIRHQHRRSRISQFHR